MLFRCRGSVEDCGSSLKQHWVNAICLRKIYAKYTGGPVMAQLNGIEPAMGCDAGLALNRNLVGRQTFSVRGYIVGKY